MTVLIPLEKCLNGGSISYTMGTSTLKTWMKCKIKFREIFGTVSFSVLLLFVSLYKICISLFTMLVVIVIIIVFTIYFAFIFVNFCIFLITSIVTRSTVFAIPNATSHSSAEKAQILTLTQISTN